MSIDRNKKIKVMHILPYLGIGGMETVLAEMLQLFDKEHFSTCVCSMGKGGELVDDLKAAGIPVFFITKHNKLDITRIWRLARLLMKERIDIVHTYSGVYRDGAIAAKLAKVCAIIHTDQGKLYPENHMTSFYHRIISNFLRDKIIAVSEDLKKYLSEKIRIDPNKIAVIPNGVNIDRAIPRFDRSEYRKKLGFSEDTLLFGIVARLVPIKDHVTLLKASANVFNAIPSAKLVIIGDGPLKNYLKLQAERLNIDNNIVFLGKRRDVSEILSILDLFVLSSKHEGTSLSILEAMAHSLPVIATRVGGNPALIDDNHTGKLVEPGKSDDMAEAIVELLTDKWKMAEYGSNARKKVVANFNLIKIVHQYENIYNSYFPEKGRKIRVMHLASNPEWAGAEVHLANLSDKLKGDDRIDLFITVFHDGKLVDFLKSREVKISVLELKWLFDITLVFRLAKMLKKQNIDILHTHGYKANFIGALAALINKSTICVRTEHGLTEPFSGLNKIKMNFYEWLDYLAAKFFTRKIISVSKDIRDHIQSKYPREKLSTIHNGIDLKNKFKDSANNIKESLGIIEDAFIVGIVGRLVPVKGHKYFIEAAKIILRHKQNMQFLIVGDGPLRKQLELAVPVNLRKHIIFTGFRDDVNELIKIMDIVVFSSIREGIPYTLLEAMLLRKAVVATKVGGLTEVITDGFNGLFATSSSSEDIAQKCLYLLENKEIIKRLGENAEKTVKDNFSADKMKEETIQIYEEILTVK